MPRSTKSGAPSEASAHSLDTSPSLPEHLTRKTTNTFAGSPDAGGSRYGALRIRPTASNVTANHGGKSKRHPGSGNSTDGGSTATDRSNDYSGIPMHANPGVGIGGWVSGIRVPSSNNLTAAANAQEKNLPRAGSGKAISKKDSNPSSFNAGSGAAARGGGGSAVGFAPGADRHGHHASNPSSIRIGIQNPDPTSYELPKKEYVRYSDGRSSSAASSDGDKYHFRNANRGAAPDFMLAGDDIQDDSAHVQSVLSKDGTATHATTSHGGETTLGDGVTADNSDSSGDDSLNTGSASSMSSNARRSKEIAARPMMAYMIALMAVPILFLTIYAGISVGEAESALQFMKDHEYVVTKMLTLQKKLQDEMLVGSELIGLRVAYGISGEEEIPWWAPEKIRQDTEKVNQYFEETTIAVEDVLRESIRGDGEVQVFYQEQLALPEQVGLAQIAANRNQGKLYREILLNIMSELSVLLAHLAEDDHSVLFRMELVDIQLLTRVEEQWTNLFSMYREIEFAHNHSLQYLTESATDTAEVKSERRGYCIDFAAAFAEMEGFVGFLQIGGGMAEVKNLVSTFSTTGKTYLETAYTPFLSCSFHNATWYNDDEMLANFNSERDKMIAVQSRVFAEVADNKEVARQAITEGMKLLAAIVSCIIGLVIVIIIQKRERSELLQVIEHSDRLTVAVRRFVPKSQLRMMGVRTVLQVEPGFATEVAQALVFTEVRNFAQLADTMSRIELFDWLQMYVARMTHVVQDQRGYVDAILGDSQFSVFPQATYAVGASIMMQQETDHMNVDLVAQKQTDLVRIGVGCHFGVVVAGVFGDQSRLSCTMVASDVNLASRLQGLTKVYGTRIILSRAVMEQIDVERFEIRRLAVVSTAGSSSSLEIFDLFQADPELVKIFKLATMKEFEKAVAYSASENTSEREKALKILKKLETRAVDMKVFDPCIPIKIKEAQRTDSSAETKVTKEIVAQAEMGGTVNF